MKSDLIVLVGVGTFTTGLWMIYAPLALLFAGAFLCWVGVRMR